jgi:CDP-diacylglycerol--glycerol-3-phosphate 3-phosphatidyltransferase
MGSALFKKEISNPNRLTLYRIAAVPIIVILMIYDNEVCSFFAALQFSVAAITDYFDGYFARKRGMVTSFGKIMDPVADKLLISLSLIMLVAHNRVPAWMVCVIIGREIAVTGLRSIVAEKGEDLSASNLGKYKTGFQIGAIIPLLLHYPILLGLNAQAIGEVMIWGALIFTVWSGIDYFVKYKGLLKA